LHLKGTAASKIYFAKLKVTLKRRHEMDFKKIYIFRLN